MSLEGLNAILKKEEVVVTRQSRDFIERAKDVDDTYRWHVSTYVPMHKGIAAEGQSDVATFARRLIQRVRDHKTTLGYLTADFGYGKTSAGLYLWQQATKADVVTVPPFQLNRLSDFLDATYGWVSYILSKSKPDLVAKAQQIYNQYTEQTLAKMSTSSGADNTVLEKWVRSGILTLDLTPDNIAQFFKAMTDLVVQADFAGLVVMPDEIQQYLEPKIKSGVSDPIAPLFNLVQTLAAQTSLPFGLLLIIPQKELNVINDQRSDFVDRIRGLTLDLKAIYGREFPLQLWEKLAKIFEFEDYAWQIFQPETLEALGQISTRDDLSNGPRTVINTFRAVSQQYLDTNLLSPGRYSPINLIDDFLNGVIVFDGRKRIQESVLQVLASNLIKNNPSLIQAAKLAAAFPVEGCTAELQARYQLSEAFDELITSGLNELVISVGDRKKGGITLRGLDILRDDSDWLTQTIREFNRNYYVEAHNTIERAVQGFVALLRHNIFKENEWRVIAEQQADLMQNHSLILEGAFSNIARRFPGRTLHIRILSEEEPVLDTERQGEVTLEFRLKRYFDVIIDEQGKLAQPIILNHTTYTATFTLNLLYQSDQPLHQILENTIGKVVPEAKTTPLFLLALHHYLEVLRINKRIPKIEDQLVQYQFQPELRLAVLDELFNKTVGAQFASVGARVVEEVVKHLLEIRYGDSYHTLMTVSTWTSNLRKYITALRQLKSPFERQGSTLIWGTKDDIAMYFGLVNTGLDNYMANLPDLIEIVDDFPTKRQSREGMQGAVRFKQHSLEVEIQSWVDSSTDSIERGGHRHPAIRVDEISARAERLGYKQAEVEQIIALLEARDLVDTLAGYLTKRPGITYSLEEISASVEHFRSEVHFLQRLFPKAAGLSKLVTKTTEFSKQLELLTSQPRENLISLISELENHNDWLEETKEYCIHDLYQKATSQANRLPELPETYQSLLSEQVIGVSFIAPVNSVRLELLKEYNSLSIQLSGLKQQLSSLNSLSELSTLSNEKLAQFVVDIDSRDKLVDNLTGKVKAFTERVAQFSGWAGLMKQGASLLDRTQKVGKPGDGLLKELQRLEQKIEQELNDRQFEFLNEATSYHSEFTRLEQALEEIQLQASKAFSDSQKAYQNALVQFIGYPRQKLWPLVIYSPLNPQGVYEQVYDYVQEAILNILSDLERDTQALKNSIRNVSASRALQFLDPITRTQTQIEARELNLQLENVYDPRELYEYTKNKEIIKDYQPPKSGHFYQFLNLIVAAQKGLREYQHKFKIIQEPLQRLELSSREEQLYKALIQHGQEGGNHELIEIREAVSDLDEAAFWQALQSLWEKQLVQIQLEGKQISLMTNDNSDPSLLN